MNTCIRCSMAVPPYSGRRLCLKCFDERSKHVYWDKGDGCRVKGPTKAECLLVEGHDGEHEGNGFDDAGPLYRRWSDRKTRKATAREVNRE